MVRLRQSLAPDSRWHLTVAESEHGLDKSQFVISQWRSSMVYLKRLVQSF
jgi:hypothetical protein